MKILQTFFILVVLISCRQDKVYPYPCLDGDCHAIFQIDPRVSDTYQDENDYHHITYKGLNYFTIMGELDELHPSYVINKIPLIEVNYDSDYWIAFDTISFRVPIYSVLSWYTNRDYNNLIPIGNIEITLTDLAMLHPPLNIAGYQINKHFCWECPYAPTLIGTYSKYNYTPRQQFLLNPRMIGDTLKVMTQTTFNTDTGKREVIDEEFNIIID